MSSDGTVLVYTVTVMATTRAGIQVKPYPKLTRQYPDRPNVRNTNVYCGHVDGRGNPTSGCHRLVPTIPFYYQNGGCTSTVSFCEECAALYEAVSEQDAEFHRYNIENDESVFAP